MKYILYLILLFLLSSCAAMQAAYEEEARNPKKVTVCTPVKTTWNTYVVCY